MSTSLLWRPSNVTSTVRSHHGHRSECRGPNRALSLIPGMALSGRHSWKGWNFCSYALNAATKTVLGIVPYTSLPSRWLQCKHHGRWGSTLSGVCRWAITFIRFYVIWPTHKHNLSNHWKLECPTFEIKWHTVSVQYKIRCAMEH